MGLETEISNPHDDKATRVGETSVIVTRGADGPCARHGQPLRASRRVVAIEPCHAGNAGYPGMDSCVEMNGREVLYGHRFAATEDPLWGLWTAYRKIMSLCGAPAPQTKRPGGADSGRALVCTPSLQTLNTSIWRGITSLHTTTYFSRMRRPSGVRPRA